MAMIACTECGKKFSEKAKFCPNCGIPIEDVLKELKIRAEKEAAEPKKEDTAVNSAPQPSAPTRAEKKAKAKGYVFLLAAGALTAFYLVYGLLDWFGGDRAVESISEWLLSLAQLEAPDLLGMCGLSLDGLAAGLGLEAATFPMLLHFCLTGVGLLLQLFGLLAKVPGLVFLALIFFVLAILAVPACMVYLLIPMILVLIGGIRMKKSLR